MRSNVIIASLLLGAALAGGCGEDGRPAEGPPRASKALLVGTWRIDPDATWDRSKAAILADYRTHPGLPDDPAAREQAVRDHASSLLAVQRHTFAADGIWRIVHGGAQTETTYRVERAAGDTLHLIVGEGDSAQAVRAVFETEDRMRYVAADEATLVFVRE